MFTDIVGYTSMTQSNEPLAMKLLEKHRELIRPVLRKHSGREVKTMGDAFLIEFDSALEAVECAVELQKTLHQYDEQTEGKLLVRIGIHVGDVIHRKGDVYGDAVNIASRIEPLAEGGDICMSEQVYDQVRNKSPFPLVKLESLDLKNVTFPIDIYRVKLPWTKRRAKSQRERGIPVVSVVKRSSGRGRAVERRTIGKVILKLAMKDRITVVKMMNDSEIPGALARFSNSVDYGRGETLHITSVVETVTVVIDSRNLGRLTQFVPKKNILGIYHGLAEIIVSLSEDVTFTPGVIATISFELARNKVNILEYFTSTPHTIVIVSEKDALKSYRLLQKLASSQEKQT